MTMHLTNLDAQLDGKIAIPHVVLRGAAPQGIYRSVAKRVLDIGLVVLTAPVTIPVIVFLALLVMLGGGNPFYSQLRVGRGGRSFRMWKLRTMVCDADKHLALHLQNNSEARREWDTTQKLKNDPRITRVGWFLRKTSLDELPQLFNVFNGSMSLVGPRPMMIKQQILYDGYAYYKLRPGITGLWQISDRNECNFIDRVRYDNEYDQDLSFITDLKILLRTVSVVLRGTGY